MRTFARLVMPSHRQVQRDVKKAAKDVSRASRTAAKVEGFRQYKQLKKELKAGTPGGARLDPLTEMARRSNTPLNRKPLSRMATAVRYHAEVDNAGGLTFSVGFLDFGRHALGTTWMRAARLHQKGFRFTGRFSRYMTGKIFAWAGARIKKRQPARAKFLFLKKTTRNFAAPARPIIEPYWAAHSAEAGANIHANFHRKMRGERI